MLGCFTEVLPLAWERVADNSRTLVFENAGPFAVARMVLREMKAPPYGIVAFGGGKAFVSSVRHLATLDFRIESISYVGDLDREGLTIPQEAVKTCISFGLSPIRPATELHSTMLASAAAFGQPEGWPGGRPLRKSEAETSPGFIADALRAQVGEILRRGNRVPEEVLGPEEMRGTLARMG